MTSSKNKPTLFQDSSFWGMTSTQLLGAFNDNVFKQLVLLLCIDFSKQTNGSDYQSIAMGLFALPFVLLSGFAGYLSDKWSKRTIIVGCKVLEIIVMLAGLIVFFYNPQLSNALLFWLFSVLCLMSIQSALFGPSKYGVLPELFSDKDLPQVNGSIQMTTFLAIILGTAIAGYGKSFVEDVAGFQLWHISLFCVAIAVIGTGTSLLLRRTPIANENLPFTLSSLAINKETFQMLRTDRKLLGVLLVSSIFWFIGGLVLPGVNEFGKTQLAIGDFQTSLLATCMGIGIAMGCLLAGMLSQHRIRFGLVTAGAWGLVVGFALLAIVAGFHWQIEQKEIDLIPSSDIVKYVSAVLLVLLGVSAGLFAVPLQVFMQSRPPEDQKGRMIGAMNLVNWIGILLSAIFFGLCSFLFKQFQLPISMIFVAISLIVLPVALFYHPETD